VPDRRRPRLIPCRQNIYGPGGTGNCVKAIQSLANVLSISKAARREAGTCLGLGTS
jgi:hypothetical protein